MWAVKVLVVAAAVGAALAGNESAEWGGAGEPPAAWAAGALLGLLGGARGRDRLTVCAGRGVSCPAALWRRRWAVTRASCVGAPPLRALRVLRDCDRVTCDHLAAGVGTSGARGAAARWLHPRWGGRAAPHVRDLALLLLDRHYDVLDAPANATDLALLLHDYAPWMEAVFAEYWTARNRRAGDARAERRESLRAQLRTFGATVALPGALLMALYLFVTFCTGAEPRPPYKNTSRYEALHADWHEHAHAHGDAGSYFSGQV